MANLFLQTKFILFGLVLFFSTSLIAQDANSYAIAFKTRSYLPPAGNDEVLSKTQLFSKSLVQGKYYLLLQFQERPSNKQLADLSNEGIQLLEYFGAKAYLASIPMHFNFSDLSKYALRGISPLPAFAKLSPPLLQGDYPDHAVPSLGVLDLSLIIPSNLNFQSVVDQLKAERIRVESTKENLNLINVRVLESSLQDLASRGFISLIEPIEAELKALNHKNPQATRSSIVRANFNGGLGLTGKDVVVGIGDGGSVSGHIDTEDRMINLTTDDRSSWMKHQDVIAGIIGGAGNLDPWCAGIAPKATMLAHLSSQIFENADLYHANYGMTITNNSYGPAGLVCSSFGTYNSSSQILDQGLIDNPELTHVFACGNSGDDGCTTYPDGYGTIIRSYASAKNIIAVGSILHRGSLAGFSSKGPTKDGRIKPEIVAPGFEVKSTGDLNNYIKKSGTSMSTAVVSGDLALITEFYKRKNAGGNPRGDLLKAVTANTAIDHGNPGPDYAYGFGTLNTNRAVKVIDKNQYLFDQIDNASNNTHHINIPTGAYGVKVMLYWHDEEGNPALAKALTNDLDLEVNSNGQVYHPWVLNPAPANVKNNAERGLDSLNNIEQVTLMGNELASGQLTIEVKGSNIPVGPQSYVLTYDIIMPTVEVTYPAGGEDFIPGYKGELVRWDAFGPDADNVKIEYSVDNGNAWTEIPTGAINQEYGYIDWSIPANINTSTARIRATMGAAVDLSAPFQIIPVPANLTTDVICKDQVRLSWNAVPDAIGYEILRLDTFMQVIGTTSNTDFLATGLAPYQKNFLSVRAIRKNGTLGRQAISVSVTPTGTNCASIYDVGVESIISPSKNGRQFTSISLANQPIIVNISNHGNEAVSNFPVNFQVDGGTILTETFTGTVATGESVEFTFTSSSPDLENAGAYSLKAWTSLTGDTRPQNDITPNKLLLEEIANPAFQVAQFPHSVNFDQLSAENCQENIIGISGIDRVDYGTTGLGGRLRINAETNFNINGSTNAITLDATYPEVGTVTNELFVTYNLEAIKNDMPELGVQFAYMQHQQEADPTNRVFARGSDTDAWVEIYNLYANQPGAGTYKAVERMNILPLLQNAGQTLSSSFQLKFCQTGSTGADDEFGNDGYTFDNIQIDDGVSLPIELAYFIAEKSGNNAILKWSTLMELNNKSFQLEYANGYEDGQIGEWQLLEEIRGAGTINKPQYYQTIDRSFDKTAYRYYRLKQVDFDGTFTYSETRVVRFDADLLEMEVFPNPTVEVLNIKVTGALNNPIEILITDMSGRTIKRIQRPAPSSDLTFETIKIGNEFPEGFYIVTLNVGDSKKSHKIYKAAE